MLCERYADNAACWREASYLASHESNHHKAISLITKAIELLPDEPALYFKRTRDNLLAGNYMQAIKDANNVLDLSTELKSIYYVDMALFYKAEALYRYGDYKQAYESALQLPAGIGYWLDNGMRTREDILKDLQT